MQFASTDIDLVQARLSTMYSTMRITPNAAGAGAARMSRIVLGPGVSVDRMSMGFSLSYTAAPVGRWCIAQLTRGNLTHVAPGRDPLQLEAGQLGALSAPGHPNRGSLTCARYDIVALDPGYLTRVAGPRRDGRPIELVTQRADTPAGRRVAAVISHVIETATCAEAEMAPLTADTLGRYLTTVIADAFGVTADPEVAQDRNDAHPETVRRAISFLESHVREPITLADIAAAAFVTPRAVQLAFRAHLDTTPMRYLHRLRLAGAHEQLQHSSPGPGVTVTAIARHWGFTHPGRFSITYREQYGHSPQQTLRR